MKLARTYKISILMFFAVVTTISTSFCQQLVPYLLSNGKYCYVRYGEKNPNTNNFIQYDEALPFKNGMGRVKIGNLYGFVDQTGEIKINPTYIMAYDFNEEGLSKVYISKKSGFINKSGQFVIDPIYEDIIEGRQMIYGVEDFSDGMAKIYKNEIYSYIDNTGSSLVSPKFQDARNFKNGCAAVQIDDKWGFINKKGDYIISPQYSYVRDFSNGLAKVKIGDKFHYVKMNGDLINKKFDEAGDFHDGLAIVKIGKKFGYIDTNGQTVIKPIFEEDKVELGNWGVNDEYGNFCDGIATAFYNSKPVFFNTKGKIILMQYTPAYTSSINFNGNIGLVRSNKKLGAINKDGKMMLKCIYESLGYFEDGIAYAKRYDANNKLTETFYVDTFGVEYIDENIFIKNRHENSDAPKGFSYPSIKNFHCVIKNTKSPSGHRMYDYLVSFTGNPDITKHIQRIEYQLPADGNGITKIFISKSNPFKSHFTSFSVYNKREDGFIIAHVFYDFKVDQKHMSYKGGDHAQDIVIYLNDFDLVK